VRTLYGRRVSSICGNLDFSEVLMKRMWEFVASNAERNCLTVKGRSSTVLSRIVFSKSSPKGFSPKTPITIGEVALENVEEGHPTNFAKLNKNAALIWYWVGGGSCAMISLTTDKHARLRTKINIARKCIILCALISPSFIRWHCVTLK